MEGNSISVLRTSVMHDPAASVIRFFEKLRSNLDKLIGDTK